MEAARQQIIDTRYTLSERAHTAKTRATKELLDSALRDGAAQIAADPNADISHIEKSLLGTEGGLEVADQLNKWKDYKLKPIEEAAKLAQKKADAAKLEGIYRGITDMAFGRSTPEQVQKAIMELNDPEMAAAAFKKLGEFNKAGVDLNDPNVSRARTMIESLYGKIPGTNVPPPTANIGAMNEEIFLFEYNVLNALAEEAAKGTIVTPQVLQKIIYNEYKQSEERASKFLAPVMPDINEPKLQKPEGMSDERWKEIYTKIYGKQR
jgi:hypothetical protein